VAGAKPVAADGNQQPGGWRVRGCVRTV